MKKGVINTVQRSRSEVLRDDENDRLSASINITK